ncbi:MAG TPA: aspartate/glutamate racemase family protein [Holophaga sp.]|nr:aspartate/glutamate racemase family protein [Holophaga sp.]
MRSLSDFGRRSGAVTVVITDSGLGGLLVCADLERRLRETAGDGTVRLVYVNAWPDPRHGYNDLPDLAARAAVFDRALAAMTAFHPDFLLIACNTLSVIYEATAFGRAPVVPVTGILDEGTDLFHEALTGDPEGVLALFGTRTTIGSGVHIRRLSQRGIDPKRIFAEACHGLAAAIDRDPDSPDVPGLVEDCVLRMVPSLPPGAPLYAGLACTHYAYAAEAFRKSLSRHGGVKVEILDPGKRLIDELTRGLDIRRAAAGGERASVEVISKIELPEAQRQAVARRIGPVSAATARALLDYRRIHDLF